MNDAIIAIKAQGQNCDHRNIIPLRFTQNGKMDNEEILKALKERGKKKIELARFIGITQDKLTKALKGERKFQVPEADKIAEFFGLTRGTHESGRSFKPEEPGEQFYVPVYAMADAGTGWWSLFATEPPSDFVERPAILKGVPNAFAVYVAGESMAPRYLPGETIFIHPAKPPAPNDFVLIERDAHEGQAGTVATIKQYIGTKGDQYEIRQLNPEETRLVPKKGTRLRLVIASQK